MDAKILLLFFIVFGSFYRTSSDIPKYFVQLDSVKGRGVLNQCSRATPKKVKSCFYVEDSTLSVLKEEFTKIKGVKSSFNSYIKNLDDYAYQVIGVVIKNEEYIYINAFPIDGKSPDDVEPYWKENPVAVCDGGHDYWGILFNIKNKEFSDLHRNGPGPVYLE